MQEKQHISICVLAPFDGEGHTCWHEDEFAGFVTLSGACALPAASLYKVNQSPLSSLLFNKNPLLHHTTNYHKHCLQLRYILSTYHSTDITAFYTLRYILCLSATMPVDLFTLIKSPLSRCSFSEPPLTYTTSRDCPPIRKDFFYQNTPKLHLGETEKALQLESKQFELGGSDSYAYIDKRALITGDVVKFAHDEIVAPMEAAFCSLGPDFWQVSSMVPVHPQSDTDPHARRIEFVFGDQDGNAYALLTILSPRSIKLHEWTGTADGGSPSSLGPRIRT